MRAKSTILVSRTANDEINSVSAASMAARKRELSGSFVMVAIIADVSSTIRTATQHGRSP